jgi:hypothetical protein
LTKKRKKKTKKFRGTPLAKHQRYKKQLKPPLLTLPGGGLTSVSYVREFLPDLLWVATVLDGTSPWSRAVHEPLEVIKEVSPPRERDEGEKVPLAVDGRISTFALVPEEDRAKVCSELSERTPWALPDELGHALSLYPDCPALWLFDLWKQTNSVDPEVGLRHLKQLIRRYGDREAPEAADIRMVPLIRLVMAGQLHLPAELHADWWKYPDDLDDEGREMHRSGVRAMYNIFGGQMAPDGSAEWAEGFWRQNWKISACERETASLSFDEDDDAVEEAPPAGPPLSIEAVHSAWTGAVRELGAGLRERQMSASLDLWNPTPDEVRLGLASRQVRLLFELLDDPNSWLSSGAAHVVRSMIDTRITTAWLLARDEEALYERFKDYGLGKGKLYKLHLEDFIAEHGASADLEELHEALDREVNAEILEEFQQIDLGGTFSGRSIREMAEEAALKPMYTLTYQPLSSEAHGEWGSLRRHDLDVCVNPLHRYHRVGAFASSGARGNLAFLQMAFDLTRATVTDVFDKYAIDVEDLFDGCLAAMNAAMRGTAQQE